jgi:site-specific DNA recombinase
MDALPVVPLHPTVVRGYREQIEALATAIAADPAARLEAMPKLRALIERLVFTPRQQGRGVEIEIEGRLTALLALATGGTFPEIPIALERVKPIGRYRTPLTKAKA